MSTPRRDLPPEVVAALQRGELIGALKRLLAHAASVEAAKRTPGGAAAARARKPPPAPPPLAPLRHKGLAPGEVPRSSGFGWWLLAAAVVVWALWRMWQRGVWI